MSDFAWRKFGMNVNLSKMGCHALTQSSYLKGGFITSETHINQKEQVNL
jgi:hypothetical protein